MTYRSLFISHGAPDIALRSFPAHHYLKELGKNIGQPKAILILSAHNEASAPDVSSKDGAREVFDFGGFAPALRHLQYRAPGDGALADRVVALLQEKGFSPTRSEKDYDHGVWTPLHLLRPEADIPIVQISVNPDADAEHHYRLGEAVAPLANEGVLIIGSGALTHNLHAFFRGGYGAGDDAPEWVNAFARWVAEKVEEGDVDALLNWQSLAPYAAENHPTHEHLLPFFFALGAARGEKGARLHASTDHAVIAMDVYGWS